MGCPHPYLPAIGVWKDAGFFCIFTGMKKSYKEQLQTEVDAAFLYRTLSEHLTDPSLSGIYASMSEIEAGHARKMLKTIQIASTTASLPPPSQVARLQVLFARLFGWSLIVSNLYTMEKNMAKSAIDYKARKGDTISGNELNHFKILSNLNTSSKGVKGGVFAKIESRHKSVGGNALRAAILGATDGLVTNMSLIMGIAGAAAGNKAIILAGFAGLLAGAISMALGEWLSVKSSGELNRNQVDIETAELDTSPEEELIELSLIYQSKGMEKPAAEEMARKVFENRETAVETLVKEELGLDSNEPGGSAWEAALTSFILFAVGAIIPLIPFLLLKNHQPIFISLLFSTFALFLLGSLVSLFTGKRLMFSGFRQVVFGLVAASVTYGIGHLLGVIIQ
jgi:vacuolar iron transporter family protein